MINQVKRLENTLAKSMHLQFNLNENTLNETYPTPNFDYFMSSTTFKF